MSRDGGKWKIGYIWRWRRGKPGVVIRETDRRSEGRSYEVVYEGRASGGSMGSGNGNGKVALWRVIGAVASIVGTAWILVQMSGLPDVKRRINTVEQNQARSSEWRRQASEDIREIKTDLKLLIRRLRIVDDGRGGGE